MPRNFNGLFKSQMLDMSLTLFSLLFLKIEIVLGTAPALADRRHFPADLTDVDVSMFQGNPVKKSSSAWETLVISRSLPRQVAYLRLLSRDLMCSLQISHAASAPTAKPMSIREAWSSPQHWLLPSACVNCIKSSKQDICIIACLA